MGGAPEGTVAGLSTDYLRAADAAERLQQNLDKDHALLRRFTAGVLHQARPRYPIWRTACLLGERLLVNACTPCSHSVPLSARSTRRAWRARLRWGRRGWLGCQGAALPARSAGRARSPLSLCPGQGGRRQL